MINGVIETTTKHALAMQKNEVIHWPTRPPKDEKEMRQKIIDGKDSIICNLPHPRVHQIKDHAYLSIVDCIAHLLGYGVELDVIKPNPTEGHVELVRECPMALEIKERGNARLGTGDDVIILWILEWSDDFDPNNTKDNRNSIWIRTVTISFPSGNKDSDTNTFVIAVGPSKVSHEKVEKKFNEEMKILSTGPPQLFYSKATNQMVKVHAERLAYLADQPERRASNFLMLGNSTHGARFGVSCNIKSVISKIPACAACTERNLSLHIDGMEEEVQSGFECSNWETSTQSGILDFEPEKEFPKSEILSLTKQLSPLSLTYEVLANALEVGFQKCSSGEWGIGATAAYLRAHCINQELIDSCTERARNLKNWNEARANHETHPKNWELYFQLHQENPDMFSPVEIPALWKRQWGSLSQCIDVIMHLIFLGVVKTEEGCIKEWCSFNGKESEFGRFLSEVMESIQNLGLSWCKADPSKGGLVSENYLANSRLIKWMTAPLAKIAKDKEVEIPWDVTQDKWLKEHNISYLKKKGINTKGSALEVRKRVKEDMEKPGGPSPNLPPMGGPVENVFNMVKSLSAMVASVMVKVSTPEAIVSMKRNIKVHLTMFNVFQHHICLGWKKKKELAEKEEKIQTEMESVDDKKEQEFYQSGKGNKRKGKDKEPIWLSTYNFMCLINLVKNMLQYGPLRNFWEGKYIGEAMVKTVKPEMTSVRRLNWAVNLLLKLYQKKGMFMVFLSVCNEQESLSLSEKHSHNLYIYKDFGEVL